VKVINGPVTNYLGWMPNGTALCECVHGKFWPEGDYYEPKGSACAECSQASLRVILEREKP
jgi:hypothetical protein